MRGAQSALFHKANTAMNDVQRRIKGTIKAAKDLRRASMALSEVISYGHDGDHYDELVEDMEQYLRDCFCTLRDTVQKEWSEISGNEVDRG